MKRTAEQQATVDVFNCDENLIVEAGAGTGKTSTIVELAKEAQRRGRRGRYIAFNRAIVAEAGTKLPDNVTARTAHSLAFEAIIRNRPGGHAFASRLNGGRVRGDQIARQLGITPFMVQYGQQAKVVQRGVIASLAQRAIRVFCASADRVPSWRHVPYVDGIDLPLPTGERTYVNNDKLANRVGELLPGMWDDLTDPEGTLPYDHHHYLKAWELSGPVIPVDFLVVDEAQDLSPVMLSIVEQQRGVQLVLVGDSAQAIYGWLGAVDALAATTLVARTQLSHSFRFGQAIADVANAVLERLDVELRLRGAPELDSWVGEIDEPRAVLTRTNAVAMQTVLDAQREGRAPLLLGGGSEIQGFADAAHDLMTKGRTSWPDLACFDSWMQVCDYVRNDPQGDELALNVSLVEEYGIDAILTALRMMPRTEDDADVVVSTAHKAKGREWSSVKLASDFREGFGDLSIPEWRLLYVACTRAQHALDLTDCSPMCALLGLDDVPVATITRLPR